MARSSFVEKMMNSTRAKLIINPEKKKGFERSVVAIDHFFDEESKTVFLKELLSFGECCDCRDKLESLSMFFKAAIDGIEQNRKIYTNAAKTIKGQLVADLNAVMKVEISEPKFD